MPRQKELTYTENKPFSKRLRELMTDENKTQTELAAFVGCTRQAISLYATGQSTPDIDILLKIAQYFHVSTDYLLGLTDVKTPDIDIRAICEKTGLSEEAIQNIFDARNNEPRNKFKRMPVLNSILETWSFFSLLSKIAQFIIANDYAVKKQALLDDDFFNNVESLEKKEYEISGISEEIFRDVSPHDVLLFQLHNQFEGIIHEVTKEELAKLAW